MKCSLLTLSCALDGELSRERQLELDQHLITCDRCKTGMRYLREETERISVLAPVQLSGDTATALLERSRVLVSVTEPALSAPDDAADRSPDGERFAAPDPFGAFGIAPALSDPPLPTDADERTPDEPSDELAADASATDEVGAGPEDQAPEEPTALEGAATDLGPATAAPDVATVGEAPLGEPAGAAGDVDLEVPDNSTQARVDADPDEEPQLARGSAFEAEEADLTEAAALAALPEDDWLAGGPIPADVESAAGAELAAATPVVLPPTPVEPAAEEAPGADFPTAVDPTAEQVTTLPEDDWLNADDASGPASASAAVEALDDEDTPAPPGAAATAAAAGAGAAAGAAAELDFERAAPEPGPAGRPSSIVVPGWEPATELNMPWADIPAAAPAASSWASDLAGVPVTRDAPLPPPAPFPAAPPPTRPAAAAIPGLQGDSRAIEEEDGRPPRRGTGGGSRRPTPPRSGPERPQPRSWTRTGLIAVAALAAVLILWDVTHGGQPTAAHHPRSHSLATASAQPSPSTTPTPSATPTPLTLTGTQSVGGGGSGYQMQTARYGVHGSQLWVVFQMVDGSGSPQVTAGFDGSQTIYVEMQGVAPGTAVPQPAAGTVVSSVSIGHVAGFTGAVYILHLTRAVQMSPSLVPGTESGGPGERYLLILQ